MYRDDFAKTELVGVQNSTFNYNRHDPAKHRHEVLQWLCPQDIFSSLITPAQGQGDQDAHKNAGASFMSSSQFGDWVSGKEKRLWGMAPPGAGKTFLVSRIQAELVHHTILKGDKDASKVAVLYMHYGGNHSADMMLACILRQFIQDSDPIPPEIEELRNKNPGAQPDTRDLVPLIQGLANDNNLFLVVDAWDECNHEVGRLFLNKIAPLDDDISIFITSRFTTDTESCLSDFQSVKISATVDDIRDYVSHIIAHNKRLNEFVRTDKKLENDIKHKLISQSGRNDSGAIIFLLVRLHMDSLKEQVLLEDVRIKLNELKHDINDKYRDIIKRIGNQDSSRQKIAVNALAWITHAYRPLMAEELRQALAVNPEDRQFKPGRMPLVDDIIAFCCGMVVHDRTSDTFRLVHNTATEFMKGLGGDTLAISNEGFKDPHCYISQVIATYLCIPALEQPDDTDQMKSYAVDLDDYPHHHDEQKSYETQRRGYRRPVDKRNPNGISYRRKICTFPLTKYAGMYLDHHLRAIRDLQSAPAKNALDITYELLSQRPKRLFYDRLLDHSRSYPPLKPEVSYLRRAFGSARSFSYDDEIDSSDEEGHTDPSASSREITPLHLAAHIGITDLVSRFLGDTALLQVRDYSGLNPLGVALCSGYTDVVLCLLKAGSNLDLESREGCHLLLFAAQSDIRAQEVVRRILEHSLLIPSKGRNFFFEHLRWLWILAITKLRYHGSRIFQLCQASLPCWRAPQPDKKESPSTNASSSEAKVEKTVHFSLSAENLTTMSPTPSTLRIPRTYSEAIFTPKRQEQRDYIKLVAAALHNDCEKIESLVEEGRVLLEPCHGRGHQDSLRLFVNLALFLALENNNKEVVKLLIEGGVSKESRDFNHRTPLHRAVIRGNVDLVEYLIACGAEVNALDVREETPWTLAVRNHDAKMCGILVKAGANVHTRSYNGETLLYEAAAGGKAKIVKLLLDQGVNPSVQTAYGWSSLHWAAGNGMLECVRLLLDAGAEVNPLSDTQKSPLDMAIDGKQTEIGDILQHKGAKTSAELYSQYGAPHYSPFSQWHFGDEESHGDSEEEYSSGSEEENDSSEYEEESDSEENIL
ncbi:Inversin [Fusarium culmorum]|uniref:Inversin n=1 Tax=Fusarium culmorum TaxID=5516 RepID=A0A2T4GN25_FUSCU|nr:Inversin [Fusarium culmorum]